MTVQTTDNTIVAIANGVQTVFPYDFRVIKSVHLEVYFDGVLEVGGYTVSGLGDAAGGNVTFSVAPADTVEVKFVRVVPYTQEIDYGEYDSFPAEVHERGLDLAAMRSQQLLEVLNRTVKFNLSDVPAGGVVLPAPVAFRAIGYDVNGDLALLEVGEGGDLVVTPLNDDIKTGAFGVSITNDAADTEVGRLEADPTEAKVLLTAVTELLLTTPLVTVSAILNAATLQQGGTPVATLISDAVDAHEAAGDPHPGYLTPAEGNAAYDASGAAAAVDADLDAHTGDANIHFEDAPADSGEYIRKNNAWATFTALANPMTTPGDIIVGGTAGAATRLALGAEGMIPSSVGGAVAYANKFTLGIAQDETGAPAVVPFTGIPASANVIYVALANASTNGNSQLLLQLGTSGGLVNSGYTSIAVTQGGTTGTSNSGFRLTVATAAMDSANGVVELRRLTGNLWVSKHFVNRDGANIGYGGGIVDLGGVLDRLALTTIGGTNTFDSLDINIGYA